LHNPAIERGLRCIPVQQNFSSIKSALRIDAQIAERLGDIGFFL